MKRKQALLENNLPGIANWRLIGTMSKAAHPAAGYSWARGRPAGGTASRPAFEFRRHRTIDLLMPEENSSRCSRASLSVLAFELVGRDIAKRRMQALFVVDLLDELGDGLACMGQVAVFGAVNLLVFQRFHE